MPLVDYASSDEVSEDDSEIDEKEEVNKNEETKSKLNENVEVSANANSDDNGELFSSLPKPRKTFSVFEDDNKLSKLLLNKNSLPVGKRESVKISVPSISDFEDDIQQPASKKIKPSAKSAGLFSILPPPKNIAVKQVQRNLVPHVFSKNQSKKNYFKSDKKNANVEGRDGDDDDDDTLVGSSFFGSSLAQKDSITDSGYLNVENLQVQGTNSNFATSEKMCVEKVPTPTPTPTPIPNCNTDLNIDDDNLTHVVDPSQTTTSETVSAEDNPLELDEKALQILCGNKKKRQQMPMNIINLSSEEVLPDSKEWLLKQFTEEKRGRGHGHKKHHGPSSQSRRKHQITYLAYQAKEQELELQNQWANNRMSRKQTQSKYGF